MEMKKKKHKFLPLYFYKPNLQLKLSTSKANKNMYVIKTTGLTFT